MDFESVAFISELPAKSPCACWVLADVVAALPLVAVAPLRFALTAASDVAEASACGATPSANALTAVASRAQESNIEHFVIKGSFSCWGRNPPLSRAAVALI
jgi:hypothetical protein